MACSERRKNQQTDEWEDGDSIFVRCNIWREQAEAVAECLVRGTSVIVVGQVYQRSYEDREGQKRYVWECKARQVAAQVSGSQHVKVSKIQRQGTAAGPNDDVPPADDPWGPSSAPANAGAGFTDEPPF